MSVEHKFLKNVVAFPTSSGASTFNLVVPTLVTPVDEDTFTVYFNGQIIDKYTTGDLTQFAKYYYTIANDNSAYVADPTEVGVEATCSVSITLHANQVFIPPGYSDTTGGVPTTTFDTKDVFYISFYYTVVGAA